jgi:ribose 5-phosphate isomerase B
MKKIIIGSDKSGFALKEAVKEHLLSAGYDVKDVGMQNEDDFRTYYEVAPKVAKAISDGEYEKGMLFCGTGMGMNIIANKFKGVYAGVVESSYTSMMCSIINQANVLTMGGWVVAPQQAADMTDRWLSANFTQGFEARAEFLCNAFDEVQRIEEDNFK